MFQAFVAFVGDVPSSAERWQDDRFYGSQFLNGCNPDTIKRCTELPSKFPVTQELVGNLLDKGDTLQKGIEVGFLHILLAKKSYEKHKIIKQSKESKNKILNQWLTRGLLIQNEFLNNGDC